MVCTGHHGPYSLRSASTHMINEAMKVPFQQSTEAEASIINA